MSSMTASLPGSAVRPRTRLLWRAAISALLVLGSLTMVGVTSADAGSCIATTKWTDTAPPSSTSWQITSNSVCNDLQAAYTYTATDHIQGWYHTSVGWKSGTNGWVEVSTADNGWDVLITSVSNGTTVRGEGWSRSQNVRYVH